MYSQIKLQEGFYMNIKGKMDNKMKLVVIGIVVLVIIAVVATVIIVKSKSERGDGMENITAESSGDSMNENGSVFEPVTFTDDVSVSFTGVSQEFGEEFENHQITTSTTVAYKPNTQTTTKKQNAEKTTAYSEKKTEKTDVNSSANSKVLSDIDSFFSGVIYFDGTTISNGSTSDMEFAMNGSDFQVFSQMDGKDIAVMNYKGKLYIMNPDSMKYTEINAAVKSMMGVSEDDFKFEFTNVRFDGKSPTSVTQAKYDGKDAVCYLYKNETDRIEFISVGNEVKQMTQYSSDGTAKTVLQADEFTSKIPNDMLNFQGYSKTNIISFMKDFM